MKFKVGEKVIIAKPKDCAFWTSARDKHAGEKAVIRAESMSDKNAWLLTIDGEKNPCWWAEEWLECDHQWGGKMCWGANRQHHVCDQCGKDEIIFKPPTKPKECKHHDFGVGNIFNKCRKCGADLKEAMKDAMKEAAKNMDWKEPVEKECRHDRWGGWYVEAVSGLLYEECNQCGERKYGIPPEGTAIFHDKEYKKKELEVKVGQVWKSKDSDKTVKIVDVRWSGFAKVDVVDYQIDGEVPCLSVNDFQRVYELIKDVLEVRVGQVWEWEDTGNSRLYGKFTILKKDESVDMYYWVRRDGQSVHHDHSDTDYIQKNATLVKDVPTENPMYKGVPIHWEPYMGSENPTGEFIDYNFSIDRNSLTKTGENKLEKAKTKLEEKAYKDAREEVIADAVAEKQKEAMFEMKKYVEKVLQAKDLRETADEIEKEAKELADILGVTKEDKDQLFG